MLGEIAALAVVAAQVTAPSGKLLSLKEAEQKALASQPQITQAKAQSGAADAQADQARAPLLPQLTGTAAYSRSTANFVPRPGSLPSGVSTGTSTTSFNTFNSYNFGLTASQLIYDFGQTYGAYKAKKASAESQVENERTVRQNVLFSVRSAYVGAWAQRALVDVAKDNLGNQDKHLAQVTGLVNAGSRPEIDLAQVKADRASAALTLINAENAYETSKASLNQAMGVDQSTDFEVADDRIGAVNGEDLDTPELVAQASKERPELRMLSKQLEANDRQIGAIKGQYGPSLGVSTGITEGGPELSRLTWNWNAGATLNWPLFQGGITNARVREAEANRVNTKSQVRLEQQQVRFDVTQARLAVRAAKAGLDTAREIEVNAKERLRLAEARYQAGAGSIIELQDAQVKATTAYGQVVQADYQLSSARAQLLQALGRP
jgi:outer membrane protein